MFGAPARTTLNGESAFFVPLKVPQSVLGLFHFNSKGIVEPDAKYQEAFRTLQQSILTALTSHKELFRNPPTLESLQSICPNWGIVYNSDSSIVWSPYMEISIKHTQKPAWVDLVCDGVLLSRSTIRPRFSTVFVKAVEADGVIDFDWAGASASESSDLEEVSDIADAGEGTIAIKDPATMAREKAEAKERVRALFRAAEAARDEAEEQAVRFHATYDLSDSESAFSEWASDSEDED